MVLYLGVNIYIYVYNRKLIFCLIFYTFVYNIILLKIYKICQFYFLLIIKYRIMIYL